MLQPEEPGAGNPHARVLRGAATSWVALLPGGLVFPALYSTGVSGADSHKSLLLWKRKKALAEEQRQVILIVKISIRN
jgi:hypothetical protein